ncbi:MAG: hypothetical protein AUK47_13010 [Deltaproteobacteria bacterium CG2_30_63_29]|nr:MAG: hypothetical protein AUK47_13010 [Deltaproteobacteria bacterium CG2_30_63_29]PJB45866.1 MAG: pirin family protein [Deltaproteobacteria bacterium CG_4_9_14_3_um_filter_63_12]
MKSVFASLNLVERKPAKARLVESVFKANTQLEGAGVRVHRPFPSPQLSLLDPFVLLDETGPNTFGPGKAVGFPDHAHRGFESVTYILEGGLELRDSLGNEGALEPGDFQWLTVGAGMVHSEMPLPSIRENGGTMHGVQLWVNLPAASKWIAPKLNIVRAGHVPHYRSEDGTLDVRILSGRCMGKLAHIATQVPITYLHVRLAPGSRLEQPIPPGDTAFAYVLEGKGEFGVERRSAEAHSLVSFKRQSGALLTVRASDDESLSVLVLAGPPIGEKVVHQGAFVMNTDDELTQALCDAVVGRMGSIPRRKSQT